MPKHIKIAMGQLLVEGGEWKRNFMRAEKMVSQAAGEGADLILLPEAFDLGWTHPTALTEAEAIPGARSDELCRMARGHRIAICGGLTELDGKRRYNTVVYIDRDGNILHKYRKINVLEVGFPFYDIGQSLGVIDTGWGKIGINICADNYLDSLHIGHTLARMGAQIILSPSSWTVDHHITEEQEPYYDKWKKPFGILARYYNLVIISVTSVGYILGGPYEGKKMVGCSLAVDRNGLMAQGQFNEFAGQVIYTEFDVPERLEKGTQIGRMLGKRGYQFDEYPKDD